VKAGLGKIYRASRAPEIFDFHRRIRPTLKQTTGVVRTTTGSPSGGRRHEGEFFGPCAGRNSCRGDVDIAPPIVFRRIFRVEPGRFAARARQQVCCRGA
jgi:hypothetical protein